MKIFWLHHFLCPPFLRKNMYTLYQTKMVSRQFSKTPLPLFSTKDSVVSYK